jgi:hypothetical protein
MHSTFAISAPNIFLSSKQYVLSSKQGRAKFISWGRGNLHIAAPPAPRASQSLKNFYETASGGTHADDDACLRTPAFA